MELLRLSTFEDHHHHRHHHHHSWYKCTLVMLNWMGAKHTILDLVTEPATLKLHNFLQNSLTQWQTARNAHITSTHTSATNADKAIILIIPTDRFQLFISFTQRFSLTHFRRVQLITERSNPSNNYCVQAFSSQKAPRGCKPPSMLTLTKPRGNAGVWALTCLDGHCDTTAIERVVFHCHKMRWNAQNSTLTL